MKISFSKLSKKLRRLVPGYSTEQAFSKNSDHLPASTMATRSLHDDYQTEIDRWCHHTFGNEKNNR